MRPQLLLLGGAAYAHAMPTAEFHFGDAQASGVGSHGLQARAGPWDMLAQYALHLVVKPVLTELGVIPQTTIMDLTEKSLQAIANAVAEAIDASWIKRDQNAMASLVQNTRDYTRSNRTDAQILDSRTRAINYHNNANDLLNYMFDYGLQSAPAFQILIGVWTVFKKEELALTADHDKLTGNSNTGIVLQGFRSRYQELIANMETYDKRFSRIQNWDFANNGYVPSLFRLRTTMDETIPAPACIGPRRYHWVYLDHRATPKASWKNLWKIDAWWWPCGDVPKELIQKHLEDGRNRHFNAQVQFAKENRDKFLTSGYDALVGQMKLMLTWPTEKLVASLFADVTA